MNKKKRIGIIALSLVLALGAGIGVSAASSLKTTEISKGVIKYNDSVVIDGNSIGYWIQNSTAWTLPKDWSANATIIIEDANIKNNSLVEIYYKEDCKDLVAKSKVTYEQVDGSVTVKFEKAAPSETAKQKQIVIEAVHVTNPVYKP